MGGDIVCRKSEINSIKVEIISKAVMTKEIDINVYIEAATTYINGFARG